MTELTDEQRRILLTLARDSIHAAVHGAAPADPDMTALPPRLQEPGATFVTLTLAEDLRGCIGSLEAQRPLAADVQANALAAAFHDPRFEPVSAAELPQVRVEISVLTPRAPLEYRSAEELLQCLRPGVDGVVIERGWNRATFFPQVWEQLPEPEDFLGHLCYKAGLPATAWRRGDLQVFTYQVEKFKE